MKNIKTVISNHRQAYVDDAVYVTHKPIAELRSQVAVGICEGFNLPQVQAISEFSHFERVRLRWMKSDGHGGLVQKFAMEKI